MYEIGEYIELKQYQNNIVSKKEQNGYSDQYFRKEEVRFRVLYKDKERKKVVCIADKPTEQKLCLRGKEGYKNGVEEINRICKEISGYEEARSLTLEDIEKSKYWEDKNEVKAKGIFGEDDEKEYWLASRCVDLGSGYAYFRMFYVSGGTVDAYYLYYSNDSNGSNSCAVCPVIEINL